MKKCPNCGYVMENDKAKFCRKCGTRQPDQIIVTDDSPSCPVSEDSSSAPVTEDNRHDDGILLGGFREESPNDDGVQIPNDDGVQIISEESHREEDAISLISSGEIFEEDQDEEYNEPVEENETEETVSNTDSHNEDAETEHPQEPSNEKPVQKEGGISVTIVVIFLAILLVIGIFVSAFMQHEVKDDNSDEFKSEVTSSRVVDKEPIYSKDHTLRYYWTGMLKDGNPDGYGFALYGYDDKDGRDEYVGTMREGLRNDDSATLTYINGDSFVGSFVNDKLVKGMLTLKNEGMYFVGTFVNNQPYNGKWYNTGGRLYSTVKDGVEE